MSYKKWIHKYKYLKYELDEVKNSKEKYQQDFNSKFTFKDKKDPEVIIPKEDTIESPSKKQKNKEVKELYKKLSKKLHPDKGGSEDDFKELNNFYKEDNILEMAIKAEELNIEILDSDNLFSDNNFEKLCNNLEEKANFMKSTLAWKWALATEEERKILIVLFEQQHGVIPIK
jgi:hypothetical protein|tara:strand:- start:578 stop:1096 length:519 start_codon:yes stop_codon:yes gene_type:complete